MTAMNGVRKVCEMEENLAKNIANRNLETIQIAKECATLLTQESNNQFVSRPKLFLYYCL